MPGIVQYGVGNIEEYLKPIVDKGLQSVLLFAVERGIPKVGDNCFLIVETHILKPTLFQIEDYRQPQTFVFTVDRESCANFM